MDIPEFFLPVRQLPLAHPFVYVSIIQLPAGDHQQSGHGQNKIPGKPTQRFDKHSVFKIQAV